MLDLDDIRREYMRGIPDAYAGGPRARNEAWQRVADLIEAYAGNNTATPKTTSRKTSAKAN